MMLRNIFFYLFSYISAPDAPIFSSIVTGDNSMNVSWAPYAGTTPKNPGESFYVRYRKKGTIANCDIL